MLKWQLALVLALGECRAEDDPNLFVTVEPEECAGLAQEVDPPFLF